MAALREALPVTGPVAHHLGGRHSVQPAYPLAATIRAIAHSPDDADMTDRGAPKAWEPVVWIGEGERTGYLPEIARDALDMA